jgi:ribosomal protein S18 acetylase RimI-like enzyme
MAAMSLTIRAIRSGDAEQCGIVAYEAHQAVASAHNFPPEHPSVEFSIGLFKTKVGDSKAFGILAEDDGHILGSIFLNAFPDTPVAAIGPLTVLPSAEGGVGRRLMEAALKEARRRGVEQVRLVQSPSHLRSLALYAKSGFTVREPLALVQGKFPLGFSDDETRVRSASPDDFAACHTLCVQTHGFARHFELSQAIRQQVALVVERSDRITGYATGLGFLGHAVAETTRDLCALIGAAPRIFGLGFFVPIRNGELLRWVLNAGLRVAWPANLMTVGDYQEPAGAFLPSIAF